MLERNGVLVNGRVIGNSEILIKEGKNGCEMSIKEVMNKMAELLDFHSERRKRLCGRW